MPLLDEKNFITNNNEGNGKIKKECLYSFDIFDTLVTRRVASPRGIFTIMQQKIKKNPEFDNLSEFLQDNFAKIRQEAENFCSNNTITINKMIQDVTLTEIYEVIKRNFHLSENTINQLKILEIETEAKNLVPIKENIDYLKSLLDKGCRVILISDMYLSEIQIRYLLSNINSEISQLPIYVSSEYKKKKLYGDLYKIVREKEQANNKKWFHYGDNEKSDYIRAKRFGIVAQHIEREKLKPYEEFVLNQYNNDFYVQAMIGCSLLARSSAKKKNSAYDCGCSLGGPILYNYVNWVIDEAMSNGYKTLHFVARDGYVLKEIADVIIQKRNLNVKTKYIYGSRLAWRILNEDNVNEFIKLTFEEYSADTSVKFFASRLKIPVEVLAKYINTNIDKKLKQKEIVKICAKLIRNEDFKTELLAIQKNYEKLLIQYLKQECDTSQDKIVIVDVYGSGRSQDAIADLINIIQDNKTVIGYYLRLSNKCVIKENSIKLSWGTRCVGSVIELFCRKDDGQTLGYNNQNNIIQPILENITINILKEWGYDLYLKGIRDFAKYACDFEIANDVSLNSFKIFDYYIKYIKDNLDKGTADIIGQIPFTHIGCETKIKECAPRYDIIDLFTLLVLGTKYTRGAFPYISVARSNFIFKYIIEFNKKYGSLIKFLMSYNKEPQLKRAYIRLLGFKISISKFIWRVK